MLNSTSNKNHFFGLTTSEFDSSNLVVMGIPWDVSSSFRKGAAKAPSYIRKATTGDLYNAYTQQNISLTEKWRIYDIGDVEFSGNEVDTARMDIFATLKYLGDNYNEKSFLFLGGDHISTFFSFEALLKLGIIDESNSGIIYFDAHPDLYHIYDGNHFSHACVVRRLIDELNVNPSRIFLAGIRSATPDQLDFVEETGISFVPQTRIRKDGVSTLTKVLKDDSWKDIESIYLSIDMDILDPAFAPGVGNPEPGGLTTAELVDLIHELAGLRIQAFDIVEHCPAYDNSNITAFSASKLIKEVLGIM